MRHVIRIHPRTDPISLGRAPVRDIRCDELTLGVDYEPDERGGRIIPLRDLSGSSLLIPPNGEAATTAQGPRAYTFTFEVPPEPEPAATRVKTRMVRLGQFVRRLVPHRTERG